MQNQLMGATVIPAGGRRTVAGRLYGALSGAVGAVAGIAPHVLHHAGPLAGAAIVGGASGSVLFGALGFVLTVPMLLRLRRRFGGWVAPGIALAIFAVMFAVSTVWIGPAVRDALEDNGSEGSSLPDPHHAGS